MTTWHTSQTRPTRGFRCKKCHKAYYWVGLYYSQACACIDAGHDIVWMSPDEQGKVVE